MSLRSQYATDISKEVDGVQVPQPANEDGSVPSFTIARMSKSNKRYQQALTSAIRPHQRAQQLGTLPTEVAEKIFLEVFCQHILKGWTNVLAADVTGDDKAKGFIDYNKENAIKLMQRLPDLYDNLSEVANSASMFREGTLEEEAGN